MTQSRKRSEEPKPHGRSKGNGSCATEAKIEKRQVAHLKTHPRQASLFRDAPQSTIEELARQIKERGLDRPIEIQPDGTIICGHQRVRALIYLGITEIEVLVCYDLEVEGADAVVQRLIDDNLNDHNGRRQLDILDQARTCKELVEMEQKRRHCGMLPGYCRGTVRDAVGKQVGKSGKTVERLMRLAEMPMELQTAASERALPMTVFYKVAVLPKATQEQIAASIRNGKSYRDAIATHLPKASKTHRHLRDALVAFVKSLRCGLEDLDHRADKIRWLANEDRTVLDKTLSMLERIVRSAQQPEEPRETKGGNGYGAAEHQDSLTDNAPGEHGKASHAADKLAKKGPKRQAGVKSTKRKKANVDTLSMLCARTVVGSDEF